MLAKTEELTLAQHIPSNIIVENDYFTANNLMKKITLISLFLLSTLLNAQPVIAVLSAVADETAFIAKQLAHKHIIKAGIYHYSVGNIGTKKIIILTGGIGKINAAVATTNLIQYFHPSYLLFTGSAGAIKKGLNVGDVIIVSGAHDFDYSNPNAVSLKVPFNLPNPATGQPEKAIYFSNHRLLTKAMQLKNNLSLKAHNAEGKLLQAKFISATIASSDHFPDSSKEIAAMNSLHLAAVAMETASFLKACWLYHAHCIAFRGISDSSIPHQFKTKFNSWNQPNEHLAANNAAAIALALIKN